MTRRLNLALSLITLVALFGISQAYIWFSPHVGGWPAGMIICANDCTQYNNMATELLDRIHAVGETQPYAGFHRSPLYQGFVAYVALHKAIFGDAWKTSFLIFNSLMATLLAVLAARNLGGRGLRRLIYLVLFAGAFVLSQRLLLYQKFLATDYFFAAWFACTSVLIAKAHARGRLRDFAAPVVLSLLAMFIRPNGVFLVAAVGAVGLPRLLRLTGGAYRAVSLALVLAIGLLSVPTAAVISSWAKDRVDNIEETRSTDTFPVMKDNIYELLLVNYYGDNRLDHATHKGTLLVDYPYRAWYYHDGSVLPIMRGILERSVLIFEVNDVRSTGLSNAVRGVFHIILWLAFLYSAWRGFKTRDAQAEVLVVAMISYVLFFTSICHVSARFKLPVELLLILVAAQGLVRALASRLEKQVRA